MKAKYNFNYVLYENKTKSINLIQLKSACVAY